MIGQKSCDFNEYIMCRKCAVINVILVISTDKGSGGVCRHVKPSTDVAGVDDFLTGREMWFVDCHRKWWHSVL